MRPAATKVAPAASGAGRIAVRAGFSLLLCGLAAWSLAPFAWQLVTSLKPAAEVVAIPPRYWPSHPTIASYFAIFQAHPFATFIANSTLVASGTTLLCTLLALPAAYALSGPLPGGRLALRAVLGVAIFPPAVLIIPLYQSMRWLGLLGSPLALVLPYTALNLPLSIWLLAAFLRQVPREIMEAAAIDGLSRFATLWRIVLPLALPAVAASAVLVFIFSWNEFLLALTFMSRADAWTVPVGIALLAGISPYEFPWDQISAAVVLTTIPVVLLVAVFSRRIISGLTAGAVKG